MNTRMFLRQMDTLLRGLRLGGRRQSLVRWLVLLVVGVFLASDFAGEPASESRRGRSDATKRVEDVSGGTNATSRLTPPPARKTWGNMATLQDHFDRHGRDFNAKDPEDYAAQAWHFLQRAKTEGLPAKRDDSGVLRVYDPKTRAFAAYNRNETTKTYFKPRRRDYFDDQPGAKVDLRPAP